MFIAELGLPDFKNFNLTSLRTGMMAGAPCPVEVMKRVMCEMHCNELTIGYGQTESTPVVTMSDARRSGRTPSLDCWQSAALHRNEDCVHDRRQHTCRSANKAKCVRADTW